MDKARMGEEEAFFAYTKHQTFITRFGFYRFHLYNWGDVLSETSGQLTLIILLNIRVPLPLSLLMLYVILF